MMTGTEESFHGKRFSNAKVRPLSPLEWGLPREGVFLESPRCNAMLMVPQISGFRCCDGTSLQLLEQLWGFPTDVGKSSSGEATD